MLLSLSWEIFAFGNLKDAFNGGEGRKSCPIEICEAFQMYIFREQRMGRYKKLHRTALLMKCVNLVFLTIFKMN